MRSLSPRIVACLALLEILQKKVPFHPELINQLAPCLQTRDKQFAANLVFGVLRHFDYLEFYTNCFLKKKLKSKDFDVLLVLIIGVYQLKYLKKPAYAAINETVKCATHFKKPWAKGLVNAVLKSVSQSPKPKELNDLPYHTIYSHPAWLVELLSKDWPNHLEQILNSNNFPANLTLRVNPKKMSREDYLHCLSQHQIEALACKYAKYGLSLNPSNKVQDLPFYQEGGFSIQDQAAQFAAELLDLQPNQTVLDACCAPGGKTSHILELAPNGLTLFAVEKAALKFKKLKENLARLNLHCQLIHEDACKLIERWPNPQFDRILLDPPCSATGVIRKHPDIKHHRTPQDLTKLLAQQEKLLNSLWPLLKPNGLLVYSTCSVLSSENDQQIKNFIMNTADAQKEDIQESWGIKCQYGRQILPGMDNMDGFYYAKIRKAG